MYNERDMLINVQNGKKLLCVEKNEECIKRSKSILFGASLCSRAATLLKLV